MFCRFAWSRSKQVYWKSQDSPGGANLDRCSGGLGGVEDALVVLFVAGDYVVGAEVLSGVEAGALTHFAAAVFAGENVEGVAAGGFYLAGFHQISVDTVSDYFRESADVCGDYGDFAGHGFEGGQAKGFQL